MATLARAGITPLLGSRTELTEADWGSVQSKVAAYDAWADSKPTTAVETLGLPRLRELLGSSARTRSRS